MKKNGEKKQKNIAWIIKNIRNVVIGIITITLLLNLCLWNSTNNKISIFNKYGLAIVVSNSMEPALSKNDMVVIKKVDNYQVGDIIVYKLNSELVIHRIVRINQNKIITKGDANSYEDKPIDKENIYGKLNFRIPYLGRLISFFKSKYGLFSIASLVIIMFIYSCKNESKNMQKNREDYS